MVWLLLAMVLILVVAAGVVVYVAYPHRGEDVPGAPWLGDAMKQAVEAVPALDDPLRRLPAVPAQDLRLAQHPDQAQGRRQDETTPA